VLNDERAQVITQLIGIPAGAGQEPLHAVWGRLAGVLGQLPAVLALDLAQETA
jgi:hypothetical protein